MSVSAFETSSCIGVLTLLIRNQSCMFTFVLEYDYFGYENLRFARNPISMVNLYKKKSGKWPCIANKVLFVGKF